MKVIRKPQIKFPYGGSIIGTILLVIMISPMLMELCEAQTKKAKKPVDWTTEFNLNKCHFSTIGRNMYFILEPKYQLVLAGKEGKDSVILTIRVLEETQKIGAVETRVVEEREKRNGKLSEVSRNYLAFCLQTSSIFNFGEDVTNYVKGKNIGSEGSWRADSSGAKPGLLIPGTVLLGAKYYQEIAPGIAMDRAQIISNSISLKTPAGDYRNCLKTLETTPLEPGVKEYKTYAPGIGLINVGNLFLIKEGFIKR
jgi:hypothetical protein